MPGRDKVFEMRKQFAEAHGLPYRRVRRLLPDTMQKLGMCDEEAIRLILTSRIAKKPPKKETNG